MILYRLIVIYKCEILSYAIFWIVKTFSNFNRSRIQIHHFPAKSSLQLLAQKKQGRKNCIKNDEHQKNFLGLTVNIQNDFTGLQINTSFIKDTLS